ncbi:F-box only protein 15 isoform X2 [Mastomys coucha]|uniref:F-box only protein 15 isoform X2 n=1 Tax=Mastomys coucha TaxID=35658 RepID=UPI0012616230|nr:F-box only protein 15 isoform X2 [Mastomys coucha]
MTGACDRSRAWIVPNVVHRATQSTHARARSRFCARARGSGAALFCPAARRCLLVSMATGRGRMMRPGCFGLQALRGSLYGGGATWGSARLAAGRSGFRKNSGDSSLRQDQHSEKPSSISFISLDRMPPEILINIFSYLDAKTLLHIACVNKRFYDLASDNHIWVQTYSAAFTFTRPHWKATSVEETATGVNSLSVRDKEIGYWKKEYITKQISSVRAVLTHILKPVNDYNGLPMRIKETLRTSGLGWAIILREKSGKEHIMQHDDLLLNDTSATVWWHGKNMPHLATLSTLDLYGVIPLFMQNKTPELKSPRWLSLIGKYDLSNLSNFTMIGCDRLIRIFCLDPGLLVGLWKKNNGLAFVMANLHYHQLVERSTFGSATLPYEPPSKWTVLVDNRPMYGPQSSFQLHIDIRGGVIFCLCGNFRNLFSKGEFNEDGYLELVVINFENKREHLPLTGKVGFAWKSDVFGGFIESCSVVDVTLLDQYRKPVWCLSSPVCVKPSAYPSDGPNYLGNTYYMDYMDSEGGMHAELVWSRDTEEYFMVNLVVYLNISKTNHRFGQNT